MVNDSDSISDLHRQAIQAALSCNWDQALTINQQIIELEPENTECLNRLAKAYMELGKYTSAKKIYEDVLNIDPYNPIAQKNFKKVQAFKKDGVGNNGSNSHMANSLSAALFLQEPGITKSVTLIKVAEPQKLLTLSPGQIVNLIAKNRGVCVTDFNNNYIGVLPDDIAHHLLKLIKGGNKYSAFIKSTKQNGVAILVREIYRSKKFKNQASFLDDSRVLSFSSDNISLMKNEDEEPVSAENEEEIVI